MPSSSSYWALAWWWEICKTKQGEDHKESSQTAEPHSGAATMAGGQRREPGCHLHEQHQHLQRVHRLPPTQLNNYPPPSRSLALTEMYPITITTAPCPARLVLGVFALLQQSSLQPLYTSKRPSPNVRLPICFPAARSVLGALCNRGWQPQWAQSQTCAIVSIRPTAHDHHSFAKRDPQLAP